MHRDSTRPFFTVIVPTYNRAQTILGTVESVRNQTFGGWELLIMDDGSRDNTSEVIKPLLQDARIHYHTSPNKGANVARNNGTLLAKGTFLAFLDSDDLWSADRLQALHDKIITTPQPDSKVFFTDFLVGTKGKNIFARTLFESPKCAEILLSHNFFGGASNLVVSKVGMLKVSGFDDSLPACQDHDMYLRLYEAFEFVYVAGPSVIYKTDSDNRISRKSNNKLKGHVLFYRKHKSRMTSLARLLSKKKIAVIAYAIRSPYFFRYAYAWILTWLLSRIYGTKNDRELYLHNIPLFNSLNSSSR